MPILTLYHKIQNKAMDASSPPLPSSPPLAVRRSLCTGPATRSAPSSTPAVAVVSVGAAPPRVTRVSLPSPFPNSESLIPTSRPLPLRTASRRVRLAYAAGRPQAAGVTQKKWPQLPLHSICHLPSTNHHCFRSPPAPSQRLRSGLLSSTHRQKTRAADVSIELVARSSRFAPRHFLYSNSQ